MVTQAITPAFGVKRTFYIGLSLFCALIVFTGFWPSYFGLTFTGTFEHPAVIHFHAAVYVGWLMLFIAQTWFAATGRLALHMTLGRFAIGYGVLVIVVGLTVTFGIFAIRVRADQIAQTQTAFLGVGPLLDMLVFAPFFGAAVYFRRVPELHKRLMIVATTALLIAAVARMRFLGSPQNLWVQFGVWTSPILLAMAYDFSRRRIIHPIYVAGIIVLGMESSGVRHAIQQTDFWIGVNNWMVSVLSS